MILLKRGSHIPPTYLYVAGWNWQRRTICPGGSPAHLRWIADILKLARNANRIGAIFNLYIWFSSLDRIVLLECQFSLALVLVMRYFRTSWKRWEFEESIGCGQCFKGEQITSSIILCLQSCDSMTRNISLGIVNFLCMILITETLAEKKIPRNTILKAKSGEKNWVVMPYIASADLRKWHSHNIFSSPMITDNRQLACKVELSSTSQASRRAMPGTDYDSGKNVHICRNDAPGMLAAYGNQALGRGLLVQNGRSTDWKSSLNKHCQNLFKVLAFIWSLALVWTRSTCFCLNWNSV